MSDTLAITQSIEEDARSYGFYYPNTEMIIDQIKDECREVLEAIQHNEHPERIQEEIGDLIHATLALCHHQGFNIDETISKATSKFAHRMKKLKIIAKAQGLDDLNGQDLSTLIRLWKLAK